MARLLECIVLVGFLLTGSAVRAETQPQFVGKSGCDSQFKWGPGSYSIRLDRTQRAYLVAHRISGQNVLLIVQHKDDTDQCGTVRDAVRSARAAYSFEFNCVDGVKPSAVVVGTRREDDPKISGVADRAWLIDLDQLKFVRDQRKVVCERSSYAGADKGEDLVSMAKHRASEAQKKQ